METPPWRILLVEDDEEDYFLTHGLLLEFPGRRFELIWKKTVDEAIDYLNGNPPDAGHPPDAILVDYALGAASGLDFIRLAISSGVQAPFILLTGRGDYELDLLAMQAGADDYLSKVNLTAPSLERAIRYAIERKATERALRRAQEELEQRVKERTEQLRQSNDALAQANDALAQANALLERVFSGIHLLVAYMDRNFNFIRVNENYAAAGVRTPQGVRTPDEFIGKNHFDLYPNSEIEGIFLSVLETGEPYFAFSRPFIYPESPETGASYWDWSLQPVLEPDGRVSGLVLSLLDVTERYRAAQALRRREELLKAVVTGAPLILWAVDTQGTITLSEGKGLGALVGLSGLRVGENLFDLYKDQPQRSEYLRRALDGEEVSAVVPSPNGLLFDTRYSPRTNEAGEITGVIIVSTDVTEQVRAQAQVAHQAELLDRVSDAIFATDENFNLSAWNQGAEEIYGWKAEEVLGKNCDEILETTYIGSERSAILEKTREAGQYQGEVIQYTREHLPIFLETKLTVLWDETGRLAGYAAVNRDITERKHIQAELAEVQRRLIDSVETERQHIARELHDGPMQELYGLAYEIEALRSTGSQEDVDRLADSLQAKLRQVTQTLRVTATELRPPTLAPFGLEKAIRSHAARFQENYPELKLHLDLDADGQVLSERERLALFRIYQQALANIVRHAQASRVMIQLKIDADQILLEVADNGCGFEVPARWVEFARKGHLGLVGAQERAGAIGGSLEVVSIEGNGTTIRVCVPRERGRGE